MLQAVSDGVSPSTITTNKMSDSVISSEFSPAQFDQYKVIRRNGAVVSFEPSKIAVALTKAFIAVTGGQGAASARVRELVEQLTDGVVNAMLRRMPHGGTLHIEHIQDQVELGLMLLVSTMLLAPTSYIAKNVRAPVPSPRLRQPRPSM